MDEMNSPTHLVIMAALLGLLFWAVVLPALNFVIRAKDKASRRARGARFKKAGICAGIFVFFLASGVVSGFGGPFIFAAVSLVASLIFLILGLRSKKINDGTETQAIG